MGKSERGKSLCTEREGREKENYQSEAALTRGVCPLRIPLEAFPFVRGRCLPFPPISQVKLPLASSIYSFLVVQIK